MPDSALHIRLANNEADILRCYPVMAQLRPEFSAEAFTEQVLRQSQEGFQLAFLTDGDHVRAVAGFRLQEMLSRGRFMYVDDLVTDQAVRSSGYGQKLMEWLCEFALSNGCQQIDLDSGVARSGAHRFYFRIGMYVSAFHFRILLGKAGS